MAGVDREPESITGASRERPEQVLGCFDGGTARLAHEVAMCLRGAVVRRGAVSEMRVDDHTDPLQLIEVAIHRGEVDVGREHLHSGGELLSGEMTRILEQAREQQAP